MIEQLLNKVALLTELRRRGLHREKASATDALERFAARLEPKLRSRWLAAMQAAEDRVELEALARAVQAGQVTQAELAAKLQDWPSRFGELAIDLRAGFLAGGAVAYEVIGGSGFNLRFDLINPHAVQYSTRHLPKIVQAYMEGAKERIRDVVTDAVSGKWTPREAAQLIKETIGLTPQYGGAVDRLRDELVEAGVTGERLDAKVAAYANQLLKVRSHTIARTEIIQAEVAGQRALWDEAAKGGLFDKQKAKRIWKTAKDERTCEICRPLDGQAIAYGELYTRQDLPGEQMVNVFGEPLVGPPAHPNCRCTEVLEP